MTSIKHVTLEVSDEQAATEFYTSALGQGPEVRIRAATTATRGFRGFILGLDVAGPSNVDKFMAAALEAGASSVMAPSKQAWGGYAGVFESADGTIWKVSTAATDDTDTATDAIERIVLLLGVASVSASKEFYVGQGLTIAKDYGDKYVEFERGSGTVTLALYERGNLARDFGVAPEGTGAHRLAIGVDAKPFVDPDGFAWEQSHARDA